MPGDSDPIIASTGEILTNEATGVVLTAKDDTTTPLSNEKGIVLDGLVTRLETNIKVDQNFPNATLAITNLRGEPAKVDGIPVWSSSDNTVLMVSPAADGMSALVNTIVPGTARITVTADADLGTGIMKLVVVSEFVNVMTGLSPLRTLDLGAPVNKR